MLKKIRGFRDAFLEGACLDDHPESQATRDETGDRDLNSHVPYRQILECFQRLSISESKQNISVSTLTPMLQKIVCARSILPLRPWLPRRSTRGLDFREMRYWKGCTCSPAFHQAPIHGRSRGFFRDPFNLSYIPASLRPLIVRNMFCFHHF